RAEAARTPADADTRAEAARELPGPHDEVVAKRRLALVRESGEPRAAGAPLAGPTLDDVVSRVWGGLAMGLPAACPVCHSEVVPSLTGPLSGHCTACGLRID